MASIRQQASSKTIQFNAIVGAILALAPQFGVNVPPEAVAGIMALGNYLMRFVTKEPLGHK